jgi:hypothetical protein
MTQYIDLTKPEVEQLEKLIDQRGIASVLMAISEICGEKAEHITSTWVNHKLAKQWATIAGHIGCTVPYANGL